MLEYLWLDSEAKPARALHASRELGQFIREENVIIDKTGRGGNWAFGYSGGEEEERTSSWNRPRNATAERLKDARDSPVLSCSTVWPEGQARVRLNCASVPIVEYVDLAVRFEDYPSPYLTPLSSDWNTQTACFYKEFTVEIVPVGSWYKLAQSCTSYVQFAPVWSENSLPWVLTSVGTYIGSYTHSNYVHHT